ncbi:RTA1 like protein-domain-containing protein [Annulohypoxylon maeteangense]|uniref:RTA1 like protein-domain-containing protein n=1 Tax=Annulohypoxylon maeteangense TaxID=1927788 RepID=UPI002008577B|nr:RTA1 like protein-domain-containing protein [Annulohypoxylon maeteangense]KAI0879838.1 RTA1 like protein-domain-containing protein [Annulohypoxylon maeteangense]
MENGQHVDDSIWFYAPDKGAPIFFAVAFTASGSVHFWQAMNYKSWRLTGLYFLCSLLFVAGFIARILGAFDYTKLIYYVVSSCLIYAAPPLYELCNYYVLGRVLYFVPYHSPIHPGRVLTTFAAISTVIETLSGIGAAYQSIRTLPVDLQQTGQTLLKVALIMQLVVVCLFLALAVTFHMRCLRNGINHVKINQALLTLYISSAIIMIRCIYRTVEFFDISSVSFSSPEVDLSTLSPIIRYEWFFYVFEALLMLCNSILLNIRHPRRWLPKSTKVYLARDGITEISGPGYKQERNFLTTLFDPFDVYGMIKGKDQKTRFWDDNDARKP